MQATKFILTTDENGQIKEKSQLPANSRLQTTFLLVDPKTTQKRQRSPSTRIAGLGSINGDIMSPVIEASDWDATE